MPKQQRPLKDRLLNAQGGGRIKIFDQEFETRVE
jgi:hypothetical protein